MSSLLASEDFSMVRSLVDEARFFVYAYNTTTLVTTAGLALGIFFIVTALVLYFYYYSTTTGRAGGEWEYSGNDYSRYDYVADILGYLEKAFIDYGVEQEECRRRLVCEAHLPSAHLTNKPVVDTLTHLVSQVTDEDVAVAQPHDAATAQNLQLAARHGLEVQECQAYEQACPHVALSNVVHKAR
ncbi:uncharacterized protein LOC122266251 [Penaeus japonicus]|uniref:uncharacterized protein LOC122266251 n=1 Tax=Penaeus japonicus TaxID=27405 RepID=UPI001C71230C|nr:uncharacterized protein LOC122266251 [Penaeus japonicus]